MEKEISGLDRRIRSGKQIVLAEMSPPQSGDPAQVRAAAKRFCGKVHALGASDNHDGVRMSALAAAVLIAAEGVEPILHVTTRDRNRIALVSESLGAQALGVRNLLCTSGEHQTLKRYRAAKNVFDVDAIQLLQTYANLAGDASLVGESAIAGAGPFCLGAVAAPGADPLELQVLRLAKKVRAGAQFFITQPVFDLERFNLWWQEVTRRGIHEKVAIVAGIQPLADAERAQTLAAARPSPGIPDELCRRMAANSDKKAQRAAGITIAMETIEQLSRTPGLRGFEISADGDLEAAVEILEKSGLRTE